jgi:hypothetical protein
MMVLSITVCFKTGLFDGEVVALEGAALREVAVSSSNGEVVASGGDGLDGLEGEEPSLFPCKTLLIDASRSFD